LKADSPRVDTFVPVIDVRVVKNQKDDVLNEASGSAIDTILAFPVAILMSGLNSVPFIAHAERSRLMNLPADCMA